MVANSVEKEKQFTIYCITNIINGKIYLGYTSNYEKRIRLDINKLNNGEFKNKYLQYDWDQYGEDSFKFEEIAVVNENEGIDKFFIDYVKIYKTYDFSYGYNINLKNRFKRDKWDTNKQINDFISESYRYLNFEDQEINKRINNAKNAVNKDWIYEYFSTELFLNKTIKTKNSFSTNKDYVCKFLENVADYILNSGEEKEYNKKISEYPYMIKNRINHVSKKEKPEDDEVLNNLLEEANKKGIKLVPKIKIHKTDYDKIKIVDSNSGGIIYPIKQIEESIKRLKKILTKKSISNRDKRIINKMIIELRQDQVITKQKLLGYIYFKKLLPDSTKFDLSNDTGYINENNMYKLVSENEIRLDKKEHIAEMIKNFAIIKPSFGSDLWFILDELKQLIRDCKFNKMYKAILKLKMYMDYSNEEIIEELSYYYPNINADAVSRILTHTIPNKIVKRYIRKKKIWLHRYTGKENWKTCSKCKEKLPATSDFFSPDSNRYDGLFVYCRDCR